MPNERSDDGDRKTRDADHLEEVPDGSGCTEIWEHLSERRQRARNADREESGRASEEGN